MPGIGRRSIVVGVRVLFGQIGWSQAIGRGCLCPWKEHDICRRGGVFDVGGDPSFLWRILFLRNVVVF